VGKQRSLEEPSSDAQQAGRARHGGEGFDGELAWIFSANRSTQAHHTSIQKPSEETEEAYASA
jgi:hypothetical protein